MTTQNIYYSCKRNNSKIVFIKMYNNSFTNLNRDRCFNTSIHRGFNGRVIHKNYQ